MLTYVFLVDMKSIQIMMELCVQNVSINITVFALLLDITHSLNKYCPLCGSQLLTENIHLKIQTDLDESLAIFNEELSLLDALN